ncbi:hypothetical protein RRG08_055154 [Elysia crispata]|uniref:Tetraspanin n=1 Tax=Elysia crispata TaxID=231223 RepID=A0AAE0Y1Z1_9GAST|nr:hypothetical protein RRG08_055154 [Elysia crispata]
MASSEARRICLRMTIVILNLPILIVGVASLAIGLWVILDDSSLFNILRDVLDLDILGSDILRQSSLIMVTAGAALIMLAGIGVMGALALSSCLLSFYAVVLFSTVCCCFILYNMLFYSPQTAVVLSSTICCLLFVLSSTVCCSITYNMLFYALQYAVLSPTICCSMLYSMLFYHLQYAVLSSTVCCSITYNMLFYPLQYAVVLVMLMTLESAVVVLALVFRSELENKASEGFSKRLKTMYGDSIDDDRGPFTRIFNALQTKLSCCGWRGPSDFAYVDHYHWNRTLDNGQTRVVPDQCCEDHNSTQAVLECVVQPFNSSEIHQQGCNDAVKKIIDGYQWSIFGIAVFLLFFQFIVMILTLASIVHNGKVKYEMREFGGVQPMELQNRQQS